METRILPLILLTVLALAACSAPEEEGPLPPPDLLDTGFELEVEAKTLWNGLQVLVHERESSGRVGARIFFTVDAAAERPGTWGAIHALEHSLLMGSQYFGTLDWEAEREAAQRVEILGREIEDEMNRLKDLCRNRNAYVVEEWEPECRGPRLDSLRAVYDAAMEEQEQYSIGMSGWAGVYQYAGASNVTASAGHGGLKMDVDLPVDKLELFMYQERSRMEHPVFRGFDNERQIILDQIRRSLNPPEAPFERTLRAMTYDAPPAGQPNGWFADLQALQREDHWEIFFKYFIPQNAIIVVVGDVPADEVFEMAERYFGDWQPGRPAPRLRTVQPMPQGQKRLEGKARATPMVAINARSPAVGHGDLPPLQVLAEILTGPTGLLMETLDPLATRATADIPVSKYPAHFSIRGYARDNELLPELESRIEALLHRVAEGGVSEAAVVGAINRLRFEHLQSFEEVGASAVEIGSMHRMFDWRYLNDLPLLWGNVTSDEVARVTRKYLAPDRWTVGLLRRSDGEAMEGSSARWAPLAASLEEDRPSPELEPSFDLEPPPAFESAPVRATEQGWWAPPWMTDRFQHRFAGAPQLVQDYRDLDLSGTLFTPPQAEDFRGLFENGLRAFVERSAYELPLVRVSALVDVSPLDDPVAGEGLTELMMEVMRFGGTVELSPAQVEAELDRLGASLRFSVARDLARFDLTAPAEAAVEAAQLLASLIATPRFDEAVFETYRDRAAVAADQAGDAGLPLLDRIFREELYGVEHPMARNPSSRSVSGMTHDKLTEHHRREVTPQRTVFAISGLVEPAELHAVLEEVYETARMPDAAPPSPRVRNLPDVTQIQGIEMRIVDRPGPGQAHVLIGHLGIEGRPEDAVGLELMQYALCSGGFPSRMMNVIRRQTAITSALYCNLEPGLGVRYPFKWRFGGDPATLLEGIPLLLSEMERMIADGLTEEEFENARSAYLEGHIPYANDTPHKRMVRFAYRDLLDVFPYVQEQYLRYYAGDEEQMAALRTVTLEEANRAARRYLDPENIIISVVGPEEELMAGARSEALRDLLAKTLGGRPAADDAVMK